MIVQQEKYCYTWFSDNHLGQQLLMVGGSLLNIMSDIL
jgi:hypothetical protein